MLFGQRKEHQVQFRLEYEDIRHLYCSLSRFYIHLCLRIKYPFFSFSQITFIAVHQRIFRVKLDTLLDTMPLPYQI